MLTSVFYPDFLSYLLVLLLAATGIFFIGRLIVSFLKEFKDTKNVFSVVFASYFIGVITIIALYALYMTRLNTIYLLFPILVIVYIVKNKSFNTNFRAISLSEFKTIILSLSVIIGFYILAYFVFFVRSRGGVYMDYPFYATVSHNLSFFGIETSSFFPVVGQGSTQYHFSELWLSSFISSIFHLNHLYTLLVITYPLLFSILFIGVISVSLTYTRNIYLSFLVANLFLFLTPIIPLLGGMGVLYNPKTIFVYLSLLFGLNLYLEKYYLLAFLTMCLFPSIFTSVAPGIFSGLYALLLFFIWKDGKFLPIKEKLFYLILPIIITVFVLLFYYWQSHKLPNANGELVLLYEKPMLIFKWILHWNAKLFIISIPFFIASFVFLRKKFRNKRVIGILLFSTAGCIVSTFIAAFTRLYVRDGTQVFMNFAHPLISVLLLLLLLNLSTVFVKTKSKLIFIISVLGLMGINFYFNIPTFYTLPPTQYNSVKEQTFYTQALLLMKDYNVEQIGYYRNHSTHGSYRESLNLPLPKLSNILPSGNYAPHWLSVFDLPIDSNYVKLFDDDRKTSQLYNFFIKNNFDMICETQKGVLRFIKEKNINCVVVEKGAEIPPYLLPHVIQSLEFDSNYLLICNF